MTLPAAEQFSSASEGAPVSLFRRVRRCFYHALVRSLMVFHGVALWIASLAGKPARLPAGGTGYTFVVTGTFYSDNWLTSHLRPLAGSRACAAIYMVATRKVPEMPKVVAIYPPRFLIRLLGEVPARLLVFAWATLRRRPHFVAGFHLLVNGLVAAVLARLVRARSLYFCVGGPKEVVAGGLRAENRVFSKMETPDAFVERRLLKAVGAFDLVVTMGTRAAQFFRENGVTTPMHMIPGGIEKGDFEPAEATKTVDLIVVGRIVEIKRLDVFLHAVKIAQSALPSISAVVVGDGPLRQELEQLSRELGLGSAVTFAGQQREVGKWLQKAKVFMLTSDSEGLSLALMEAMMCGLPAIVSNVGDLGDLVQDGVNGYLVSRRAPAEFAARMVELLRDGERLKAFSQAASRSAARLESGAAARQWDQVLDQQALPD